MNNSALSRLSNIYFSLPDGSRQPDGIKLSLELVERLLAQKARNGFDTLIPLHLAALQLWSGDLAGFAATRDRFLPWAAGTTNATTAEHVAKLASLSSALDSSNGQAALDVARSSVELAANTASAPSAYLALGIAEYRRGNLAAAIAALDAAGKAPFAKSPTIQAKLENTAEFYQVLILLRQGKTAEARQRFAAAEAEMSTKPPADNQPVISPRDHDLLILWLAHREAKALLDGSAPEKP